MKVKFFDKKENKVGTLYGIANRPDGRIGLYILSNNYAHGKMHKSWLLIKTFDIESEARDLFSKKINGRAKR